MNRSFILAALLLLILAPTLSSLDDLFDDPSTGIVEDELPAEAGDPAPPPAVDLAALTTAPPRFSGSVDSGAGLSLGMEEWPGTAAAEGRSATDMLQWRAGYEMETKLRVTARPQPYLRVTAAFVTKLSETTARFSNPAVDELFVDYTLADTLFFRAGKFGLTWGQARILPNIGNIVGDVSGGAGLRVTAPIPQGTATALVYTRSQEIALHGSGDPRSFTYAAQIETTRGRVSTGAAARLRTDDPLRATAYLTLGLGTVDLTQEALLLWDRTGSLQPEALTVATLSQVVWEIGAPAWRVIGEYLHDDALSNHTDHRIGLGIRMPRFLPGRWRPQLRWQHAFQDDSGLIETVFSGDLAPSIEGTIGIPVRYGEPGTVYRRASTDFPDNGVAAVALGARLKFSF